MRCYLLEVTQSIQSCLHSHCDYLQWVCAKLGLSIVNMDCGGEALSLPAVIVTFVFLVENL